jgi:hypothetical protein
MDMTSRSLTRRNFIRIGTGACAASVPSNALTLKPSPVFAADAQTLSQTSSSATPIRFAAIGTGVRGCQLLEASLLVPGIECVAVSDLYDGRHAGSRKIKANRLGRGRVCSRLSNRF